MSWPYSNSVWSVGLTMRTPLNPSSSAYWPVSSCVAGVLQADHRRDAQRPRHDGGVRGLAADIGGKAEHVALVQLRGVGRRQVVADDDARLLEVAQVDLLVQAEQIVQHARGDVAHVGGAFAQVIVLDGRQRGGVALGDGVEGVFGVDLLLLDHAHDFVEQRAVFQHQQVRVEDAAFLGAHALADLALDFEDLVPGLDQRAFQPVDFLGNSASVSDWRAMVCCRLPSTRILPRQTPPETGMPRKTFSPRCCGSGMRRINQNLRA